MQCHHMFARKTEEGQEYTSDLSELLGDRHSLGDIGGAIGAICDIVQAVIDALPPGAREAAINRIQEQLK